jgi:hypothetical protein
MHDTVLAEQFLKNGENSQHGEYEGGIPFYMRKIIRFFKSMR